AGLPLLSAARRLPGLLQRALRTTAAAAPLLRPDRGGGRRLDRGAPRHRPDPGTGGARPGHPAHAAGRGPAGHRPPARTDPPVPAAGTPAVHAAVLAGFGDVPPAVLQELPAAVRRPRRRPAAPLRCDRQPRAGDRPAGG